MISFDENVCANLREALSREWLETNGLGGFASSTIVGLNTRRYHALLCAATKPPLGRIVMLSKLEETLVVNGTRYDLSSNQYPGSVHPQGFQLQTGFRLDPYPIFTYEIDGIVVEKSVFMVHGSNTTVIQYSLGPRASRPQALGPWASRPQVPSVTDNPEVNNSTIESPPSPQLDELFLELRPLVAFRDYHSLAHERSDLNPNSIDANGLIRIKPYNDQPVLHLAHNATAIDPGGFWYRDFEYHTERDRGFDFHEDLFNPLVLKFDLNHDAHATVIASTDVFDATAVDEIREKEISRREAIIEMPSADDEFTRQLFAAADQFIVARGDQTTIIAGYHWFSDWGRDTMIALPGLTLATERFDVARSILSEFAKHIDQGMLPNRFPDAGETPEYNTVDATLWFFEAIRAYAHDSDDQEFVRANLYDQLVGIIDWHKRGTRFNIHVDDEGLLYAGEAGVQLTWMDAKVGDWVVTPRKGKPVEIQALWYNALRVMENFALRFDDAENAVRFHQMAERASASFNRQFWNERTGCLVDVIDGEARDESIRPNQIFAISLEHPILDVYKWQQVLDVAERDLLTPFGLRSLSPNDPNYRGRYEGDSLSRDGAYHQGTVWGWLIGPFISAYLKTHADSDAAIAQVRQWLSGFESHLKEAGLGQISEIFDGAPPHRPAGCIAQAWSVAEVLRVVVEDLS